MSQRLDSDRSAFLEPQTKMNLLCVLLPLLVSRPSPAQKAPQTQQNLAGVWEGKLSANQHVSAITLEIRGDSAGQFRGNMTARDLAFVRSPLLGAIRVADSTVRFATGLSE